MRDAAVCLKNPAEKSKNARHPVLDGMPGVFYRAEGPAGSGVDALFLHNDPFLIFDDILKFCQAIAKHDFNKCIEVIHQIHIFQF